MEETKKIGFFKRIKMAIFDLEKYNVFLNENFFVAFKYFLKFILLLVLVFTIATTIELNQKVDTAFNYFSNEFPDFEYKDGELKVSKNVEAYDKKYDAKLIADTGEVSEDKLTSYQGMAKESGTSTILLKDKAIIETNGLVAELKYSELMETIGITELTKQDVSNQYNQSGFMVKVGTAIFVYSFIILFVQYFFVVLENILIIAIFGWVASKLIGLKLKISKAFVIAIYGLTLSNIINVLYSTVATFTTFEIKYFSMMYFIIGYIYMMAVIFINKADLMNKDDGMGEILQVVENINFVDNNEETQEKKKKEPKKKKTDKKENEENKEDSAKNKSKSKEESPIKKEGTKKKETTKTVKKNNSVKTKKDNKDIKNEDNKD